jgi:hypothetical protein
MLMLKTLMAIFERGMSLSSVTPRVRSSPWSSPPPLPENDFKKRAKMKEAKVIIVEEKEILVVQKKGSRRVGIVLANKPQSSVSLFVISLQRITDSSNQQVFSSPFKTISRFPQCTACHRKRKSSSPRVPPVVGIQG